jgi:hypothetical protein
MNINVYWSSCEVPVFIVIFYWNLNFPAKISKNYQMSNFFENRVIGSRLFSNRRTDGRTDGQTDREAYRHDEPNSHVLQFCESA